MKIMKILGHSGGGQSHRIACDEWLYDDAFLFSLWNDELKKKMSNSRVLPSMADDMMKTQKRSKI